MLWAFIITALLGCCSATQAPRRSFLGTAFRAARSSSANQRHLREWVAAAPAPVPAPAPPPPPPPPDPFPPQFPVIGQDECSLLQEGFLVDPPATCSHVVFAENVDGCTCTFVMPANINPLPALFYNPWLIDIPPNPDVPCQRRCQRCRRPPTPCSRSSRR